MEIVQILIIRDGMIRLSDKFSGELMDCAVDIDRRMLDYIVGLDSEFSDVVDGSHLYMPTVKLEQVVLPKEQKDLIVDTVSNFDLFKQWRKEYGMDDVISYGTAVVLLFYGERYIVVI